MEVGENWAWCFEDRIMIEVESREQPALGERPAGEPDPLP
jgi:hypothetical protein